MTFSHIKYQPPAKDYYTKFKDVPADSWFAPYVSKALELGALSINPDIPLFFPDSPISKIEATKIIMTIEGVPIPYSEDTSPLIFSDVNPKASFSYLIRAAQNSGIYVIKRDKKFLPFNNISRAEAAELVFLAGQYSENGTNAAIVISTGNLFRPVHGFWKINFSPTPSSRFF